MRGLPDTVAETVESTTVAGCVQSTRPTVSREWGVKPRLHLHLWGVGSFKRTSLKLPG